MIELLRYQREDGLEPFTEWIRKLRDKAAHTRIAARLRQLESGNPGDAKPIGEGITELRIHAGPGYRVYCARHGQSWIVLLCAGDKSTQADDIKKAKIYWSDWKRRQK